jgi:eukaryotic-like serine/threonine-protein kinase
MRVGPYQVDDTNRKGGQAFVYFGQRDHRDIALKVARPSDWSRRRMRREIAVQRELDHPNVAKIIDHDPDRCWYAMDKALGSLEDLGPFSRDEWTRLRVGLLAVSQAVAHAHARGYVHRELSPGNILIFSDRWVVADWGFVCEPFQPGQRMTQPLERFGTPEFLAPELLLDTRDATPGADVFSIGRLAAWGTKLKAGDSGVDDDQLTAWWRRLIDGAAAYEPRLRWTMSDVIAHLQARPTLLAANIRTDPAGSHDACARCGSSAGRDHAERDV